MSADLINLICSTRAMRRLKPEPVPPELITQILRAATAAPPASNMGGWRFLVIRDQAIKNAVAAKYRRLWYEGVGPAFREAVPSRVRYRQMLDACDYQADHLHEAPVWIVPCHLGLVRTWDIGSGIYPAVQNMLLAARALGLGATLTTLFQYSEEAEAMLGVPDDAHSYAILPIGYPLGNFGPVAPVVLEDVVFADRWGENWSGE